MNHQQKIRAAIKLYEDFTGHAADNESVADVPDQDLVMIEIGSCVAIAYEATRDGETAQYQHEFSQGARPALAVSHDGRRLYLLAGAYKFTSHGIEDR